MPSKTKTLTSEQRKELISTLKTRFEKHPERHKDIAWTDVQHRVESDPDKFWSLYQMENTGGEPDVVGRDKDSGEILFYDCSPESPKGRRSLCYDRAALEARKKFKPKDNAMDVAKGMGIELLTEDQYRELQQLGKFDQKTSSWVKTPDAIRRLGGAVFCDRRYDTVFLYHNGADSYYAARGFRGWITV